MKIGANDINAVKIGSTDVNKVYLGSNLVWEKSSPLFLDLYPNAAAAFSYYKLRSDYSGNCIRIRRAGDDAPLDVGFVDGYIDTNAITTFCGANDGFLSIDYDQSTNSNNKTQTEATKQPKIYDGATGMMILNGKESKRYEAPHVMNLNSSILVNSAFIVNNALTLNGSNYIFGTNLSGLNGLISKGSAAGVNGLTIFSGTVTPLGNTEDNNQKLHILTNNATNTFLSINGNALSSFTKTGNVYASSVGNRQSDAPSFGALDGNIQFEAYYTTDQSSNVAGIQSFLNSSYNVYADDITQFNPYNVWDSEHITINGTTTTIHDFNNFGAKYDMSNPAASNQPTFNAASTNFNNLPSFTFDGIDDYFKANVVNYRNTDATGVFISVFRHLSGTYIFSLSTSLDTATTRYFIDQITNNNYRAILLPSTQFNFIGSTNIETGSPSTVATYGNSGSLYFMDINGTPQTTTPDKSPNDGSLWLDSSTFNTLSIGGLVRSNGVLYSNIEWCMSGYFPYTDMAKTNEIINFLKNKYGIS